MREKKLKGMEIKKRRKRGWSRPKKEGK